MSAFPDLPAPMRAALPALVMLLVLLQGDVAATPDGWEAAWAARCLWGLHGGPLDCIAVDGGFRPPGLALLVGPLSLLMHPVMALGLVCIAAFGLCAIPVGELGRRLAGGPGRLGTVALFACTPALAGWALVPDARAPALLLGLAAWTLALRTEPRLLFAAGMLAGLGPLFRPEAWAGVAAMPLMVGALHRGRGRSAVLGLGVGVTLTLGAGVWSSGAIGSTRLWEGHVLALAEAVPLEWAKQLFGLGIVEPPMRARAREAGGASGRLVDIDLGGALRWLGGALGGAQGLPVWVLAGLGLIRAAGHREGRWVLAALLGASAPQLAALFIFQARNAALPLSNLQAPLAAGLILAGAGACALADLVPRDRRAGLAGLASVLVAAGSIVTAPAFRLEPGLERTELGEQAIAALLDQTDSDAMVVATFATGPVVLRSERPWQPWPAPWDRSAWNHDGRRWLVMSSLDETANLPAGLRAVPRVVYRRGTDWIALAELSESTATP
ncbi:MAG: hypothetical protein VX265_10040 [Myxococcota bacterium]|nr:hypothetical protein [Myxococcota bacterium]